MGRPPLGFIRRYLYRIFGVDMEWATRTFRELTRTKISHHDRIILLNHVVAARVAHPDRHPGGLHAREVWEQGVGWCDQTANLVQVLARGGGYKTRLLTLRHTDRYNEHIVVEVYYNRKWHLFDPDHGIEYYLEDGTVADLADLLADPTLVTQVSDAWMGLNGQGMDGFYKVPPKNRPWLWRRVNHGHRNKSSPVQADTHR